MELGDSAGKKEMFMKTLGLDLRSCVLGRAATYTFEFCRMVTRIGVEGETSSCQSHPLMNMGSHRQRLCLVARSFMETRVFIYSCRSKGIQTPSQSWATQLWGRKSSLCSRGCRMSGIIRWQGDNKPNVHGGKNIEERLPEEVEDGGGRPWFKAMEKELKRAQG